MQKLSLVPSASPLLPEAVPAGRRLGRLLLAVVLCVFGAQAARAQTATETTVYSFTGGADNLSPAVSLIQAGDGSLYGTTIGNFYPNYGGIYKVALNGTFTNLYTFNGITDSATPFAPLYQGADGNFYGTTYGNLIFGTDGVVYSITPAGKYANLYAFTGKADGENPESGVVQLSDGTFYGATSGGGSGYGTLFHVGTSTPLTTVIAFNKFNGNASAAPPVEGLDGNFYGVTTSGGSNGFGVIYKLTPTGTLTAIYSFTGTGDGGNPYGPLVAGPDGNFYGATSTNGATGTDKNGTIFRVTPAGILTTLHVFNGTTEGAGPLGVFLGGDGYLYGNTGSGGANSKGTVFRATISGTLTILYNFTTSDATAPQQGVVQASDGTIWGTGSAGGAKSMGGVYKVTLSPAATPPVTLTASSATIALGAPITLNWSVNNAFSNTMRRCNASITPAPVAAAGWSGTQTGSFNSTTNVWSGAATITPLYPGVYTYGITCGGTESGTVTVTVGNAAALTITTQSPLPTAYVGVAYTQAIGVSGGVAPYTFAVTTGTLPAGLTLNPATGAISGTPTATGASNFTVKVTDSNAAGATTTSATYALTVLQPLKLATASLPDARIGSSYSQQLVATGGTPPYAFSLPAGSALPAGLSLSSSGLISGTPTATGTTAFTVILTDAGSQSLSANLSLTVDPLLASTGTVTLTPSAISVGGTTAASVTLTTPSGSPAMTGTVQFTSNGQPIGAAAKLVNGVATITTPAFPSTGTYQIGATYSGDPNFLALGYPTANLTVTVAAQPAISITPSTLTMTTGGSATVTAVLANFPASVTLACGTLPADVSCAFTGVTGTSATLTITAFATSSANRSSANTLLYCALPGLILLGFTGRRQRKRLQSLLPLAVLLFAMLGIQGCGSNTTITKAGSGTSAITVTATAGTQIASTQFLLTIHN